VAPGFQPKKVGNNIYHLSASPPSWPPSQKLLLQLPSASRVQLCPQGEPDFLSMRNNQFRNMLMQFEGEEEEEKVESTKISVEWIECHQTEPMFTRKALCMPCSKKFNKN
jgi:hypothetical protein